MKNKRVVVHLKNGNTVEFHKGTTYAMGGTDNKNWLDVWIRGSGMFKAPEIIATFTEDSFLYVEEK